MSPPAAVPRPALLPPRLPVLSGALLLLSLLRPAALAQPAPPAAEAREVRLSLREGTWMNVDVHRSTVVFDLLGDIWAVPLHTGGEARRLTSGPAWDGQPRLSPDGRRIAYVSDAGGSEQLWVMRADGSAPRQLTRDPLARTTDPAWDPEGSYLLGRRQRLDAEDPADAEIWQHPLGGGEAVALTDARTSPAAGEAWVQGGQVWFSARRPGGTDPVAGLWEILRLDREAGTLRGVVTGIGSAARPALSPDGGLLAFVSRDRERTLLELLEVSSGRRRVLADWLSADQMEGTALRGTYPAIDWTADGGAVVLWAPGRLWQVDLRGQPTEIPFVAEGSWSVPAPAALAPRPPPAEEVQARVLRGSEWSARGEVAFSALGVLWLRTADGAVQRLSPGSGFAPAWRPDGAALAWTAWEDPEARPGDFPSGGGSLYVGTFGWRSRAEILPISGQLVNPAWSEDGRQLVVLRAMHGSASLDPDAPDAFEVVLLTRRLGRWSVEVVTTLPAARGRHHRAPRLALRRGRVWFLQAPGTPDAALASIRADGTDAREHLRLPWAEEALPAPDLSQVAWRLGHQGYTAPLPPWSEEEAGAGAEDAVPSAAIDLNPAPVPGSVGDGLAWTPDSAALTWASGAALYTHVLGTAGPAQATPVELRLPRHRPEGQIALLHARIVTMEGEQVLDDATVVIERDRIASVRVGGAAPPEARLIDCSGQTIIPGLIDVHGSVHARTGDILPEQEWRYRSALDLGVTTIHDVSAATGAILTQAERVEAGLQQGPRILAAGTTSARAEALPQVRHLQGLGAASVLLPPEASRAQRQGLADACREAGVRCIAEGQGDLWRMLSMAGDGLHAVAHALPHTPLHADVLGWWAASGAALAPALLLPHGGLGAESYFFQYENPLDHPRLLRHHPPRLLDALAWRRPVLARDWGFQATARDIAALVEAGVLVSLGSQGTLPGLSTHWELWSMAGPGALDPHQALRAATIDAARYLGLHEQLGSITPGKLADLVVLSGDPLQDIRNTARITLVIKNGEVYQ